METPILTITTLSGERVSAPVFVWLQELILMLPPDRMKVLMQRVDVAKEPYMHHSLSVPVDPADYIDPKTGRPRAHLPRRN